ncbi:MAG: hypothetical protein LW826_03005 [Candidatus Jidaibacter sp.]|jgi:hypothetical protein|nr:hypothetical protein [Candidatus Jidaibacter sp.]
MEIFFTIFGSILAASILLMFLFLFLANKYQAYSSKQRLRNIDKTSQYRTRKPGPIKLTDELKSKDRGLEKIKQEQMQTNVEVYTEYSSPAKQQDDIAIVGVAKPVGRWSSFIMKQKMGFILAMGGLQSLAGKHNSKEGFWTNLIKAQAASKGKGASKGR